MAANSSDRAVLIRELVRYATLAPSSHNTQCWKFRLHEQSISIEADLSRRTPVVDPDDHHLFVSLGCDTANLVQAALANGLRANARFEPTGAGGVAVALEPTKAVPSPLFQAITERQCTRGDYDAKPLSTEVIQTRAGLATVLASASSGRVGLTMRNPEQRNSNGIATVDWSGYVRAGGRRGSPRFDRVETVGRPHGGVEPRARSGPKKRRDGQAAPPE